MTTAASGATPMSATAPGRARRVGNGDARPGPVAWLLAAYVVAMPLAAGVPRGVPVPLLRPSEVLLSAVLAAGVAIAVRGGLDGDRWHLEPGPVDRWLLAVVVLGSVVPLWWLLARTGTVGGDDAMAALPFVKYAALFAMARAGLRSPSDVGLVQRAIVVSGLLVAVLAIAQSVGVAPLVDALGQWFVSSSEDVVDGGRATTTIGSSIATGAFLVLATGVALSATLASIRPSPAMPGTRSWWATATVVLAFGALASGQAGTVVGLAVVILVVASGHGRTAQVSGWGLIVGAAGAAALWPIVASRLAARVGGSGLPESWVVRWSNLTDLFLPELLDGGWLLGVRPDATRTAPDVWRDTVYLESGYLWLLWVGGVPLLVAALGFLVAAWRRLEPAGGGTGEREADGLRTAARGAVAMMLVLGVIDPHLTLRAGADLFYLLLAAGLAATPLTVRSRDAAAWWRGAMGADAAAGGPPGDRLVIAEARPSDHPSSTTASPEPPPGPGPGGDGAATGWRAAETAILIAVRRDGRTIAARRLELVREGSALHGRLCASHDPSRDEDAELLLWRAVARCAHSLRVASLDLGTSSHGLRAEPAELRQAARLAGRLEATRAGSTVAVARAAPTGGIAEPALPAVRLEVGCHLPRWKRGLDLILGTAGLVVALPLLAACAVLVRRSSSGPVVYRQLRIGTGGLPFQILKLRTMYVGNDDAGHRHQNRRELRGEAGAAKEADDARITPIGRHLRRLSLDELPQLVNVVRGEMSLVGPRPSLLWEVELFEPGLRARLRTRPGVTGLWQISGRADISMRDMLLLDLDYVERVGPGLDLRCLAGTAASVVTGRGAR